MGKVLVKLAVAVVMIVAGGKVGKSGMNDLGNKRSA